MQKAKCTGQNEIPVSILVEQKSGNFFVLSTPLLELPIQKTWKKQKIRAENVSRETFFANHRKAMRGRIVSPSAMTNAYNTYHEALRNDWLHNTPDKESVNRRLLVRQFVLQVSPNKKVMV